MFPLNMRGKKNSLDGVDAVGLKKLVLITLKISRYQTSSITIYLTKTVEHIQSVIPEQIE